MFGAYLCCDQARPPAGDLGRGGAVLEKRKRGGEKRGMKKAVQNVICSFFYC